MSKLLYRAHDRTDASTGFGTQFDGRLAGEPPYRRDSRGVHYEFLSCLSVRRVEPRFNIRIGVVFGVCGAIAAHTVEVWIFAFAYFFVHCARVWMGRTFGTVRRWSDGLRLFFLHDRHHPWLRRYPPGWAGQVSDRGRGADGLVLITWTASFLFLEMQRHWGNR